MPQQGEPQINPTRRTRRSHAQVQDEEESEVINIDDVSGSDEEPESRNSDRPRTQATAVVDQQVNNPDPVPSSKNTASDVWYFFDKDTRICRECKYVFLGRRFLPFACSSEPTGKFVMPIPPVGHPIEHTYMRKLPQLQPFAITSNHFTWISSQWR